MTFKKHGGLVIGDWRLGVFLPFIAGGAPPVGCSYETRLPNCRQWFIRIGLFKHCGYCM
ncbi:MAG: hypothetical protein DSM106950_25965 [Stigonema ocellatum SAG 48.90 = DSM 106950]|nr:hypothetical protein [Stigonema ocellatum SAG 48.90 = DSM 106950]